MVIVRSLVLPFNPHFSVIVSVVSPDSHVPPPKGFSSRMLVLSSMSFVLRLEFLKFLKPSEGEDCNASDRRTERLSRYSPYAQLSSP